MKIVMGSDHVALQLKEIIKTHLQEMGHTVMDIGAYTEERTDYPIYGEKAALAVANGEADRGIIICGTGVGISLAANKVNGIRCVTCSEPYSAQLSRLHNDSNMLAFGARVLGSDLAKMIVDEWLKAPYEGGRHAARVEMLSQIEKRQR